MDEVMSVDQTVEAQQFNKQDLKKVMQALSKKLDAKKQKRAKRIAAWKAARGIKD